MHGGFKGLTITRLERGSWYFFEDEDKVKKKASYYILTADSSSRFGCLLLALQLVYIVNDQLGAVVRVWDISRTWGVSRRFGGLMLSRRLAPFS